jgi:molybdopterin-containing oxidoreductase family membrane subunit
MELFVAYYSANPYEAAAFTLRGLTGPSTWAYYFMFSFNVFAPQLFWYRPFRHNMWVVMFVCMCVNAGMWFERYVIIATTLERHMIPGSWGVYQATWVDKYTFLGTFGFFMMLFLLFLRFLPVIAIGEVKGVLPQSNPHQDDHAEHGIQEEDLMAYADRHVPKPAAA